MMLLVVHISKSRSSFDLVKEGPSLLKTTFWQIEFCFLKYFEIFQLFVISMPACQLTPGLDLMVVLPRYEAWNVARKDTHT